MLPRTAQQPLRAAWATATSSSKPLLRVAPSAAAATAAATHRCLGTRRTISSNLSTPTRAQQLTPSNIRARSLASLTVAQNAPELGAAEVSSSAFAPLDNFNRRHVGPRTQDVQHMLQQLGYDNLDAFIKDAVPQNILLDLNAPSPAFMRPLSENELVRRGNEIASKNKVFKSFIGMGYHSTHVPQVIVRNLLENPAWYTAYTPYQPEISQGRLESLINFQTMVKSLTALDIANASLLDEGTAAAEAMILAYGQNRSEKKSFLVDHGVLPQTVAVLRQRAKGFGIKVITTNLRTPEGWRLPSEDEVPREEVFGVLVQYPDVDGRIVNWAELAAEVKKTGALVIAATDLLALTMIQPPGEWGADIALGNAGRFGVPPGYGGPHAAFFAVSDKLKRKIPGRLVGLSKDAQGKPAYRLALQTREQHIRREKATSNICTAQALLANMSAMYAIYHGPDGLRRIAAKVHLLTRILKHELTSHGFRVINKDGAFFDTLTIDLSKSGIGAVNIHEEAAMVGINLRRISDTRVGITLDETVTIEDMCDILNSFCLALKPGKGEEVPYLPTTLLEVAQRLGAHAGAVDGLSISTPAFAPSADGSAAASTDLSRKTPFLTQEVFSAHRSETDLLRYMHNLESKDLSLVHAMIPLGSCTMKLNATASMALLSNPNFNSLHPLVPEDQSRGYSILIRELERDLCAVTGFPAVSLQPNSGAQGEFAGLSVIRAYLDSIGEGKRDVCLIPNSAHGTNPASAIMAGMRVVAVKNLDDGSLDLDDLRAKATKHKDELAAFMVTYPSTYGVFEEKVQEACKIIHEHGGQVYMDGANIQAQLALTSPAIIGADVTHLNLHKSFSISHGGGGPGVGPICAAEHLAPFMPGHPLSQVGGESAIDPIASAPYGSAAILPIAWAYIRMLGWEGLREASAISMLTANYMAHRLAPHYKLRYTNEKGRVAHEFLLDLAEFSKFVSVTDVAKRCSDYGFHAPTCSWPISTGLLVEPTESESLAEVDRFCDAMISIRMEIQDIVDGKADAQDNVLKNAPHTVQVLTGEWNHPYSREQAVYPLPGLRAQKQWPSVGRLQDAYGDKNLICECGSVEDYA